MKQTKSTTAGARTQGKVIVSGRNHDQTGNNVEFVRDAGIDADRTAELLRQCGYQVDIRPSPHGCPPPNTSKHDLENHRKLLASETADYICLLVTRERNNGRKFPLSEIAETIEASMTLASYAMRGSTLADVMLNAERAQIAFEEIRIMRSLTGARTHEEIAKTIREMFGDAIDHHRPMPEWEDVLRVLKSPPADNSETWKALYEAATQRLIFAEERLKSLGFVADDSVCNCGGEPHGKHCALVLNGTVKYGQSRGAIR